MANAKIEKQIYAEMKKTHKIRKCFGKFIIPSEWLLYAIGKCGYDEADAIMIARRMVDKGYIRPSIDVHGRKWDFTAVGNDAGNACIVLGGNFVIQKWVN